MFDLSGSTAIVTGALGLLGPMWSETLLEAGASVIGIDRPGLPKGEAVSALCERFGDRLRLYEADILDRQALEAIARE